MHRLLWLSASRGITVDSSASFDEAVHLSPLEVNLDSRVNPRMIRLRLQQSKTDPFHRGADVFLGRTYHDICPVSALLDYLVQRGQDRGPLFTYSDGSSLSRQKLVSKVHSTLAMKGLDGKGFTGHSFRIGAGTTAKAKGVSDSTVKTLGRWRSDAFQLYIRLPGPDLATVSGQLIS